MIDSKNIEENISLMASGLNNNDPQGEERIKQDLINSYKIIDFLKLDDLTYTHITVRPPAANYFYIIKFGSLFSEASKENIIKVDLSGNILEGNEELYNKTGYVIHGSIYRARNDINAIFHLHPPASVAVSVMDCGLLPITQFAMPFFENISYYDYDSLPLDATKHGEEIVTALGDKKNMLMRSHGTLTCGRTLQEAFFYTRFLEQAAKIQVKVLSANTKYTVPSQDICRKARDDMLAFENNLGNRDWQALLRRVNV